MNKSYFMIQVILQKSCSSFAQSFANVFQCFSFSADLVTDAVSCVAGNPRLSVKMNKIVSLCQGIISCFLPVHRSFLHHRSLTSV